MLSASFFLSPRLSSMLKDMNGRECTTDSPDHIYAHEPAKPVHPGLVRSSIYIQENEACKGRANEIGPGLV